MKSNLNLFFFRTGQQEITVSAQPSLNPALGMSYFPTEHHHTLVPVKAVRQFKAVLVKQKLSLMLTATPLFQITIKSYQVVHYQPLLDTFISTSTLPRLLFLHQF